MIISVEVDAPTRSDRRISWIVGWTIAAIFAVMVVVALAQGGAQPKPTPPPVERVADVLTQEQQTYLVYATWLNSASFSDCMTERGFSREPVAGIEHSRITTVAAFLGVDPRGPDTWLAPAEARNGDPTNARPAAKDRDFYDALQDVEQGGCQGLASDVDAKDAAAVARGVEAARGDPGFYRYLAETAWLEDHPEEALLYQTHLLMSMVDAAAPRYSDRWLEDLAHVLALVNAGGDASEAASEGYADFAQGVAVAADGSMVVVRVGAPEVIEHGFVSTMDSPMIACGDVGVILGTTAFAQPGADRGEPYATLAASACDAVN